MNQLTRLPAPVEPGTPQRKRRHARSGTFGVIDIGSTKAVCLIARIESDGSPRVLGFGWQRGRGVKGGSIVDLEEAERAIRAAVGQAEEMADTRIPGAIEDIGRAHRVLVLGPSLLPAMLRTIQMGHVTIALGEKADMVRELLGATKAEMGKMDEVLGRLRKQVAAVGNTIDAAQVRTRAVTRKLRGVDAVDGSRAATLLEIEADEPPGEGDEA